ncbi:rab-like protein 3, partial [Trichonephila inaurata madagascariensis]
YNYDSEQFIDNPVPVLVIGTKQDLVMEVYPPGRTKRTASIAEECGADEIYVDCRQTRSFAPGSSNAVKLSRYFDKVIEKKYHGQGSNYMSSTADRRRMASYANKQAHVD